jgi:tetratricopeptide (TPR) repeat protein
MTAVPTSAIEVHVPQAQSFAEAGNLAAAAVCVHAALAAGAESVAQLSALAAVLFRCEDLRGALALYERAAVSGAHDPEVQRGLAFTYRALGQITQAEQAADRALEGAPADYELIHMRSSLRPQTAASNHVRQLERLLARGIDDWRGAVHLEYALAKELEDLGDYERSFSVLQAAATLKRSRTRYDFEADLAIVKSLRARFDRETLRRLSCAGHLTREPIFIFGLPRTGSTLIERILSRHPQVHGYGELNAFPLELEKIVAERNNGNTVPRATLLAQSLEIDLAVLGRHYLERARGPSAKSPRFTDKLPMNSLNAGLIQLALPGAKMILVERDPMDTCYAMYKFLFRGAYPFSYDLEQLGRYYLEHRRLMQHWATVLPGESFERVQYERLVTNQTEETSRLLNAVGLEWDDACLSFEQNPQAALTGSATQVRRHLYQSSVGAWRRYERQLTPLRRLLAAGGIAPQ